jgi:ankyrin repeat protein
MPNKIVMDDDYFLLESVKSGKEKQVRSILSNGNYRDEAFVDGFGRTALHWAAEYGYTNIVYLLVENKWDYNATDHKSQSPLHIACNHYGSDIASYLITCGCDVNLLDNVGNSPLQRAIHTNLEDVVYLICERGANINSKTKNDWTALHEAIRVGNENIVHRLIKDGADVNAVTQYKATPFSTAIFYYRISQRHAYSCLDSIAKMLVDNGSRLSQCDGQWSPLMSSISLGNSYIAGLLLYHGCQIPNQDQYGRSPLVDAFTRCDPTVVKLMVLCGYQLTIDEVEQCNRRIPTFSRSFRRLAFSGIDTSTNGAQMMTWLRNRAHNPTSLSDICRFSIRQSLNKGSGDSSIIENIRELVLPTCLKEYIALDEFSHIC